MLYFILIWQSITNLSDNGLTWLLQSLFHFLQALNVHIPDEILVELIAVFPCSLYMVRKYLNLNRDNFTKYVVCSKCTKCYHYDECLRKAANGITVAKHCSNISFSRGKAVRCNSKLVKKVVLKDNQIKYYPIFYYCYNGIINCLEEIVSRKGVPESCERWRQASPTNCMTDIYDGKLWDDFKTVDGKDFLKAPRNYGLMLNFDFFQPMKHRKDYSVGVLYLVLLNLPRSERFKWENVIVVGVIPNLEKEPKSLNEFLKPAVSELQALWKGLHLKNSLCSIPLKFRAALLCTCSDIPASRKLCGIKGHSGELGCSKCLKKFPGKFGEKRDYSGFNRDDWEKRTNKDHRRIASKILKCKTKTKINELSKKFGINYYSSLLDLEYFDVIRFCAIDPMHNLFLGTAKYVFKLWVADGHLTSKHLQQIETRIEEMEVPSHIGRLPKKIASNFGSYTAEQWKNWTTVYSLFALKGIISDRHYKCWQSFVLGCRYMCKPVLTEADIIKGDGLILKFCKEFEALYGGKAVTPNMHLHCHLRENILDYGPIHSFWCFSFERYNGILGNMATNNRSVELQLMRKLKISQSLTSICMPGDCGESFQRLIANMKDQREISNVSKNPNQLLEYYNIYSTLPLSTINWNNISAVILPSSHKERSFDNNDLSVILEVYQIMYPRSDIILEHLSRTFKMYSTVQIFGLQYGSKKDHRSRRTAGILASWPEIDGKINTSSLRMTFGLVDYYFIHTLVIEGECKRFCFACVTWYMPSDDTIYCGLNPLLVTHKLSVPGGPSRFLPVQKISCHCSIATVRNENGEERNIVCPFVKSFCL